MGVIGTLHKGSTQACVMQVSLFGRLNRPVSQAPVVQIVPYGLHSGKRDSAASPVVQPA